MQITLSDVFSFTSFNIARLGVNPPRCKALFNSTRSAPPSCALIQSCTLPAHTSNKSLFIPESVPSFLACIDPSTLD